MKKGVNLNSREKFMPNPGETEKPTDFFTALGDAITYLRKTEGDVLVRAQLVAMDAEAVVLGRLDDQPSLNKVGVHLDATIDYCVESGVIGGRLEALPYLQGLHSLISDDGCFPGEVHPDSYYGDFQQTIAS